MNVLLLMHLEGFNVYASDTEMQKYMSAFRDVVFTKFGSPWTSMAYRVDGSETTGMNMYGLTGLARWDATNTILQIAEAKYDPGSSGLTLAGGALMALSKRTTDIGNGVPDTTPPSVSITFPIAGSAISCTVPVSANASDNVSVQSVQFKVDGAVIGTDTTSPYSTSWDTLTVANASHSLTAVATDAVGNTAESSAVTVTVSNLTPCLALISNLTVINGKPYEVVENGLQNGTLIYIDRNYTYSLVPTWLEGITYIKTANDDKSDLVQGLSFELNQPATVYVAHDNRYETKPDWLLEFEDTGEDLTTSISFVFSIFRKSFPAGSVSLGSNAHPSEVEGNSMYTVIVLSDNTAPAPPTDLRLAELPQ